MPLLEQAYDFVPGLVEIPFPEGSFSEDHFSLDEEVRMRRLLSAAMMVVSVNLLAQTSPPAAKSGVPPKLTCVVAGRVVTAADGSPLKSARVSLTPERSDSEKQQMFAATTDSDGHFLIKDVVPGRYHFFATRAGFVNQQYQARGNADGAVLSLKPGDRVGDVLFRMIVSGVITGRVTNEDGEGIVRVEVIALRKPGEEEMEEEDRFAFFRKSELHAVSGAQTDDRGQYRIFGLKPGDYYIEATDSYEPDRNTPSDESYVVHEFLGSEYASVYYPSVAQASQATLVSVKAGDEVQADVFMQRIKTAEISGHVIGRGGPAKNASVLIFPRAMDDFVVPRQDTTDEKGAFKLKGIPPGSYVIAAYKRDDDEGSYGARGQQKLEVSGENIDSLTIAFGGGASFQGRVTAAGGDQPELDRISIFLLGTDEDRTFGAGGQVKKDGTFQLKSVFDGSYAIMLEGLEKNWYVKSVRLGADELIDKGLQVEAGGTGGRLEVVVSSASAQLEGSVSGHDGAIIGARVRVAPEPETPYNRLRSRVVRTDQSGHFSVTGLAPGTYRLLARYRASGGDVLRSDPETLTLSERDHKTLSLTIVEPPAE
ncbi:MAG: carboxypeptidase regulatory-like domain-containing protein [Terriglobales bacterium]